MTYQVEVLPQALGDIELAYRWMADKLGAQVAEDWYDELMEAVRSLEQFPNRCPIAPEASEVLVDRIQRQPEFARALLGEAIAVFLNGEPDMARLLRRDLMNGTIGFEGLAAATGKPSKSLHRMLSAKGNPTMDNLTLIFGVLRRDLGVKIQVQTVVCA